MWNRKIIKLHTNTIRIGDPYKDKSLIQPILAFIFKFQYKFFYKLFFVGLLNSKIFIATSYY